MLETYWVLLILVIAAGFDLKTRRIPNNLILTGLIILLILQTQNQNLKLPSLMVGTIISLTLWQLKLIGGGDSKLLILVSTLFLVTQLPWLYLCISLAGSAQALFYISKKQNSLPYAVAILLGTIIFILQNFI